MNDQEYDYSSSGAENEQIDLNEDSEDDDKLIKNPVNGLPLIDIPSDINRVLVLCRRGIAPEIRHFMIDFNLLIHNPIKAPKFKGKNYILLNNIADEQNCNSIALFETRHTTEHYLWFGIPPGGPTICFYLENFHRIAELHFKGKCSKTTRPLIFFDPAFNSAIPLKIAKEILKKTFSVPYSGTQSHVDTVYSFLYKDEHIWFVRYQVLMDQDPPRFIEAGPRFCLHPVLILSGSFCGKELYRNPNFVPPHKRPDIIPQKKPENTKQ